MSVNLITAKAAKRMPQGKGTYGSKRGRPTKKKSNPFSSQGKARAKSGKKPMPPAFLANMKKKKAASKKKK